METKILEKLEEQKALIHETAKKWESQANAVAELVKKVDGLEKAFQTPPVSLPGVNETKETFSFSKLVHALSTKDFSNAGFEKEVIEQTQKAMAAGVNAIDISAGTAILPNQYIAEIIEMLLPITVVIDSGATILGGLTGSPVEMPRQTAGINQLAADLWVAENNSSQDKSAEITFTERMTLKPKMISPVVKISSRLIKLGNPSIENFVRMEFAKKIALAIDYAALYGAGGANIPYGIITALVAAGTPYQVDFDTKCTFEKLIALEGIVEDRDSAIGALGFIWHPKVRRKLRTQKIQTFDGADLGDSGAFVVSPATEEQLKLWVGANFKQTTMMPIVSDKTAVVYGNWNDLVIAQWGGMEITASNVAGTAFVDNQTWIKVNQELDINYKRLKSFSLGINVSVLGV